VQAGSGCSCGQRLAVQNDFSSTMSKRPRLQPPDVCPVCGEEVPRNALACRGCGADHNSGWRVDADLHDALGAADEEFDYEDFVRNEFETALKPAGIKTVWWITGLILIVVLTLLYFWAG
jgi:hypothetical protein